MQTASCPICQSQEFEFKYEKDGYTIVHCLSCTHEFVNPSPSEEEIKQLYQAGTGDVLGADLETDLVNEMIDREKGDIRTFYGYRLKALEQAGIDKNARILDFGCNRGSFVRAMNKSGYINACGFDLSEPLVQNGRERWGLDLHAGNAKDFFEQNEGQFDLIFSANVFEHLYDPQAGLQQLKQGLKKNGALVIMVPNAKSLQFMLAGKRSPLVNPPYHLHYFTPSSMTKMFCNNGVAVDRTQTFFWLPDSDFALIQLGFPAWLARIIRHGMKIPGVVVERMGLGGEMLIQGQLNSSN